ncbi:MAG TPA: 6-hydroxymethylpterin diphosphokinase MptE-like protein [Thermoplasmata archaeon]|nr:6-hydroxymethylpterin diphosphokinase MptE-like protein [Thermoplasmata archaeon]
MDYDVWAPRYARIRAEFGFPFEREVAAADALERLLRPEDRRDPLARLAPRIRGRDAIVVGDAPGAGPPPLWRLPPSPPRPALLAADGATAPCLAAGLVPSVIVTDLDGPVPSEVSASGRGSLVLVHAHGDNVPALERWVPEFPGELAGSWAGPPRPGLIDVGGFTDGDRAAYLAEALGARRILLWAFDFERVDVPDPSARAVKLAKLRWARELLGDLARSSPVPVLRWGLDGSLVPYSTG